MKEGWVCPILDIIYHKMVYGAVVECCKVGRVDDAK